MAIPRIQAPIHGPEKPIIPIGNSVIFPGSANVSRALSCGGWGGFVLASATAWECVGHRVQTRSIDAKQKGRVERHGG